MLTKNQKQQLKTFGVLGKIKKKRIKINLPHDTKIRYPKPVDFVINQTTGKKFYYSDVCTVPKMPGKWSSEYSTWIYDSEPLLAPCRLSSKGIVYLDPKYLNQEDKLKLLKIYRQNIKYLY